MNKSHKPTDDDEDDDVEFDEEQLNESASEDVDDDDVGDVTVTPTKEEEDDDEDDEDDDVDDAVQDADVPKKRVHVYHQVPECTEIKMVTPGRRITSEYMTVYEFSMIVGTRATHIAAGSVLYTDPQSLHDPRDIAKKEIAEGKCPLSITRKVSPTTMEVWEVNEMIKPQGAFAF